METFSAILVLFEGNSPVTGEFPSQRPVTRSFDVSFELRLNNRSGKPSRRRWFKRPSRPLWRHRNVIWIHFSLMRVSIPIYNLPHGTYLTYFLICLYLTTIDRKQALVRQCCKGTGDKARFGNMYVRLWEQTLLQDSNSKFKLMLQ